MPGLEGPNIVTVEVYTVAYSPYSEQFLQLLVLGWFSLGVYLHVGSKDMQYVGMHS